MLAQKPSFFILDIREGSCEGIPTANDFLFHIYEREYTLTFRNALRRQWDGWRYQREEDMLKRIHGLQRDLPYIRIEQKSVPIRVLHIQDMSFGCIPIGYFTAEERPARPILERTLADYERFFSRRLASKTDPCAHSFRTGSLDEHFSPDQPLTVYVVRAA